MLASAFDSVVAVGGTSIACVRLRENDFQNQSRKLAYISPLARILWRPHWRRASEYPSETKEVIITSKLQQKSSSRHRFFRRFFRDDAEAVRAD